MKAKRIAILALGLIVASLPILAGQRIMHSRIFWDNIQFVGAGQYSRMIELQNGDLFLAHARLGYTDVVYRRSTDGGQTWSGENLVAAHPTDSCQNTAPDVIQLKDGTILYCWNQRTTYKWTEQGWVYEDIPGSYYGVFCAYSTDNGYTWSKPVQIYLGSDKFADGCWEPNLLELPNGDIQCYFADESKYTTNDDQEIVCCTSHDKGKTWSARQTVCYRQGHRDGMPCAKILPDGNTIAVVVEDNGTPQSNNFRPVIVRTTLDQLWQNYVSGDDARRNTCFNSDNMQGDYFDDVYFGPNMDAGAPYMTLLNTGEVAISFQSDAGGLPDHQLDICIAVGDKDARNFHTLYRPFHSTNDTDCVLNSIMTLRDGSIYACGTNSAVRLYLSKGTVMQQGQINYGPIAIDGKISSTEQWTKSGKQLFWGGMIGGSEYWSADFSYSKNYLNMLVQVNDPSVMAGDGITLAIDGQNRADDSPNKGCLKIWADKDGNIVLFQGVAGQWVHRLNTKGVWCKSTLTDKGYQIELAVPWLLMGITNPSNQVIAVDVERVDKQTNDERIIVTPSARLDRPYTWLSMQLGAMPGNVKDKDDRFDYDKLNLEEAIKEIPSRSYTRRELLYPNGNPDDNGFTAADEYLSNGWWYKVAVPWMEIYIPEGEVKGTILTIPGGGYGGESYYQIGEKAADFFLPLGYAVAALKYRLPNGHDWIPLEDACQAMEMLRNNQVAWGLGYGPIGCFGESAGGHLAASLATKFRSQNARPDFSILLYPVISLENGVTHVGTRDCLLGGDQSQARIDAWSLHKQVNTNTSPCFITACQDDDVVPVINSVMMYQALAQQKIKNELFLMPKGKHGWAINGGIWQDNVVQTAMMRFINQMAPGTDEPTSTPKLTHLTPNCVVNVMPDMMTDKYKNITVAGSPAKGYKTYFAASTAETGEELWATDGRHVAYMVKDITPGPNGSDIQCISRFNDKVVFRANRQLWISDGTEAGTYELKDNTGASMFDPLGMTQLNETQFVYGSWINGYHALYVSDGTQAGTQMIYSYMDQPGFFTLWPGEFGNEQGKVVMDHLYTRVGRKVFFKGVTDASGEELWVTDGTKAGTHMVKEINTENNNKGGAAINWMVNYKNKKLFFKAWSPANGNRMWVTDGTEAGTKECVTTPATSPNWFGPNAVYGDKMYVSAYSEADGRGVELFAADENGNMNLVADINPGLIAAGQYGSWPVCMGVYENNLMIAAQNPAGTYLLYRYDGTNLTKVNADICFADNGYTIVNGTYYNYGLVNGQWGVFTMNKVTDTPNPSLPYLGYGTSADGQRCGYSMRNCGGVMVFSFVYGDWTQNADNRGIWAYSYKQEGGVTENLEEVFDEQ